MQVLLEVAIGLVLTFAVLAVVVSSVMELVSAAFRMRARTLEQGIARLLDDQRKPGNSGVLGWFKFRTASEAPATQAVMNHPLIRSLSSARAQDRPPSYIGAITFATAFLGSTMTTDSLLTKLVSDVAALDTRISALPGGTQPNDALKAAWQSAQKDPAKLIDTLLADDVNGRAALKALLVDAATVAKQIAALEAAGDPAAAPIAAAWEIAKVPSKTPAKSAPIHDVAAFIDELATPDLISRASAGADSVHRGIQQIAGGNPHLGKSLNDLWQRADRDFGKFRHEIEDWFDREMARVSGWYSRW